ncbi:MAG: hypothetical protein ABI415_00200 [Flavitalea sp.]
MKYLSILGLFLMTIATSTVGQKPKDIPKSYTREARLKRSHDQKIAAWVLLGGGIIAIAMVSNGNQDFGTTGGVAVIGSAAILGSVPLFLAARRNKRRANRMEASFNF